MLEYINNPIFAHLCKYPNSKHHIRELARQLNLSPPTILEYLKPIQNLIKKNQVGRSIQIMTNQNDKFIQIKKWINLFLLIDSETYS
ncbi:MAG: hypothetical protein ACOCUR_03100, partial [Nanoarchaeota archaeon]